MLGCAIPESGRRRKIQATFSHNVALQSSEVQCTNVPPTEHMGRQAGSCIYSSTSSTKQLLSSLFHTSLSPRPKNTAEQKREEGGSAQGRRRKRGREGDGPSERLFTPMGGQRAGRERYRRWPSDERSRAETAPAGNGGTRGVSGGPHCTC